MMSGNELPSIPDKIVYKLFTNFIYKFYLLPTSGMG
jgi:hypothetical protein